MKPPLTTEARKTPITDKNECRFSSLFAGEDAMWVHAKIARELETANQVLTEALEEARKEIVGLREALVCADELDTVRMTRSARGIMMGEVPQSWIERDDRERARIATLQTTIAHALQRPTP